MHTSESMEGKNLQGHSVSCEASPAWVLVVSGFIKIMNIQD